MLKCFASIIFISLLTISSSYANHVMSVQEENNSLALRIAVSSNFAPVLAKIIPEFIRESGIQAEIISGSSGTLYQQIKYGAPFDLFLSADDIHPKRLTSELLIVENSLTTYAIGQLAFWLADKNVNSQQNLALLLVKLLEQSSRIAMANPNIAPYGQRAFETLNSLGLWTAFQNKTIIGINVNQTFQQIRSQSVAGGFVALSQLKLNELNGLLIPEDLYSPINQQLVILKRSKNINRAKQFIAFLLSKKTQNRIVQYGYKALAPINVMEHF